MTMPAGNYWVGDLCYVLENEWDEVCDIMNTAEREDPENYGSGEFVLSDGRRFAIYKTRWGDGTYEDAQGRKYPVDSGTIGCILAEDITPDDSSNIIHFRKEFDTEYSDHDRSVIKFGHIHIDTENFPED